MSWETMNHDSEAMEVLRKYPRYKNNALKSLYRRSIFFIYLILARVLKQNKPLFVVLATNNNCNIDCTYCYGSYGKKPASGNYSTRKLLSVIDDLKSLGCKLLTIHGGESLLRKDIGEILNYAKWNGFYVSFNTNGYLVPNRIQELMCVDTLIFSLDGREETNDRYRGKGCFQKVMEGMEVALANKLPVVISATLTDYNDCYDDMLFLAKLGKERGVRIQYSILYNHFELQQGDQHGVVLPDEGVRKVTNQILELKNNGYPIYYADNVLKAAVEWPFDLDKKRTVSIHDNEWVNKKGMIPCYHGKLKYQIDGDGRVVRCWALNKASAPNILKLGVAGALDELTRDDECQHCAYMANNEHNAMLNMNVPNLLHVMRIQLVDAMKIGVRWSAQAVLNRIQPVARESKEELGR